MYKYRNNRSNQILLSKLPRMFCLFVFCITNIIADVIKLDNNELKNCGVQDCIITQISQDRIINNTIFEQILTNKAQVLSLIDNFYDNKLYNNGQSFWQMHGLCIFKLNDVCEVLISKKRNIKANGGCFVIPKVAWNDPYKMEEKEDNIKNKEQQNEFFKTLKTAEKQEQYYASNLFNYSTSIHTERQLNLGALYVIDSNGNVREEDNPINTDVTKGKLIHRAISVHEDIEKYNANGCIMESLKSKLQMTQKDSCSTQTISGSMYIYTSANPCQNVSDNGGISCVEYYNELSQLFPNIKFNVYFDADEMQLNKEFFVGNERSAVALCSFVESLVDVEGLRFGDNCIQLCRNGNWEDIAKKTDDSYNIGVEDGKNDKICILIKYINCCLRNRSFSQDKKSDLFNLVHNPNDAQGNNIPNIHYHPI